MPLLIAAIKLIIILAGSAMEFIRSIADIRDMMKKMFADSKAHVKHALKKSQSHYHKKRGRKHDQT